jgi:hypothetical protein
MKKAYKIGVIMLLLLTGSIAFLGHYARVRQYSSAADFEADGGEFVHVIPPQAENCRFALKKAVFGRHCAYDFTLSAADAEAYTAELTAKYRLDSTDENDLRYGYAHWFGKSAAECTGTDAGPDAIPRSLPFSSVTERDITSAEILVYYPQEAGSRCFGILRFPDSGEFVCFYSLTH